MRKKHGNEDHGYARVGKRRTEHIAWTGMLERCYNPKHASYKWYGARGITVAEEWHHDFRAFLEHIGDKPGPEYSLDRIDNSKGYHPGNVRWTLEREQQRNRRSNKLTATIVSAIRQKLRDGMKVSILAAEHGVSITMICHIRDNKTWVGVP